MTWHILVCTLLLCAAGVSAHDDENDSNHYRDEQGTLHHHSKFLVLRNHAFCDDKPPPRDSVGLAIFNATLEVAEYTKTLAFTINATVNAGQLFPEATYGFHIYDEATKMTQRYRRGSLCSELVDTFRCQEDGTSTEIHGRFSKLYNGFHTRFRVQFNVSSPVNAEPFSEKRELFCLQYTFSTYERHNHNAHDEL